MSISVTPKSKIEPDKPKTNGSPDSLASIQSHALSTPKLSIWRSGHGAILLGATAVICTLVGGFSFASATLPPTTSAVAVTINLPAGHILQPHDLKMLNLHASTRQELSLVPDQLRELVVGEVLTRPIIAGSAIHNFDIRPNSKNFKALNAPSSSDCAPAP